MNLGPVYPECPGFVRMPLTMSRLLYHGVWLRTRFTGVLYSLVLVYQEHEQCCLVTVYTAGDHPHFEEEVVSTIQPFDVRWEQAIALLPTLIAKERP